MTAKQAFIGPAAHADFIPSHWRFARTSSQAHQLELSGPAFGLGPWIRELITQLRSVADG